MRILITSDLHLEQTGSEHIRRLVAGMSRESPDLVVLAGDLGNPSRLFEQCLSLFLRVDCPVAVVPGNHDVWGSHGETSALLYEEILPEITASFGFHWLERDPLIYHDGTAICGSIGWYDYSAQERGYDISPEEIERNRARHCPDGMRVDWGWSDLDFAERCRLRLQKQAQDLEAHSGVDKIVAVTHVPVFANQLEHDTEDENWALAMPYYGHLTLGESLRGVTKLRYVVSGHTHMGVNGIVDRPGTPIATAVVGSDYDRPRWVCLEL